MIFDTHAHYEDARFDEDRAALLASMQDAGVGTIVDIGCDRRGVQAAVALAEQYDFIYAAVGLHPQEAARVTPEDLALVRRLAKHPKVRAIGEIGLDYHYEEDAPRDLQKPLFAAQMALAQELGMPVCIHDREAHADTMEIVRSFPKVHGVLHCFSGSLEMAQELLPLGYYFGFNGVVTFKNARKCIPILRQLPEDRLLLETDCPYLAPEPYRGRRCDSAMLCRVAETIADIRGVSPRHIIEVTEANARRFYGL